MKYGLKTVSISIIKVHKIICIIKNLTYFYDSFYVFCNLKKIKYLKPILDVKIYWNSTYYILKHFKELESVLVLLIVDEHSINNLYPNDNDLISIKVNYKIKYIFFKFFALLIILFFNRIFYYFLSL